MEFIIYIVLAVLLLWIFMRVRRDRVPHKIKEDFHRKFPEAKNCDWSHPKDYYEVVFYHAGSEKKVKYDEAGYWIETKTAAYQKEIPQKVLDVLNSKFNQYTLDDISKVANNRGQLFFKLIADTDDVNYLLKIDIEGRILQIRDLTTDKLQKKFRDKEASDLI